MLDRDGSVRAAVDDASRERARTRRSRSWRPLASRAATGSCRCSPSRRGTSRRARRAQPRSSWKASTPASCGRASTTSRCDAISRISTRCSTSLQTSATKPTDWPRAPTLMSSRPVATPIADWSRTSSESFPAPDDRRVTVGNASRRAPWTPPPGRSSPWRRTCSCLRGDGCWDALGTEGYERGRHAGASRRAVTSAACWCSTTARSLRCTRTHRRWSSTRSSFGRHSRLGRRGAQHACRPPARSAARLVRRGDPALLAVRDGRVQPRRRVSRLPAADRRLQGRVLPGRVHALWPPLRIPERARDRLRLHVPRTAPVRRRLRALHVGAEPSSTR